MYFCQNHNKIFDLRSTSAWVFGKDHPQACPASLPPKLLSFQTEALHSQGKFLNGLFSISPYEKRDGEGYKLDLLSLPTYQIVQCPVDMLSVVQLQEPSSTVLQSLHLEPTSASYAESSKFKAVGQD